MREKRPQPAQESALTRPVAAGEHELNPAVEAGIRETSGLGSTLDTALEQRFGADGDVRIHSDATSDELAQSVDARAFTVGSDVYFATGEYRPDTVGGADLLAHELTHVVQQRGAVDAGRLSVSDPDGRAEREAEGARPQTSVRQLALQREPQDAQRLARVERELKLVHQKENALAELLEFQNKVLARVEGWEIAATKVGSAYATAAKRITEAFAADKEHEALQREVLAAVLVAVTAGAFSWIVAAGELGEAELLGSKLEHAGKGGVERLIVEPEPMIVKPPPPTLFDPLGKPIPPRLPTPAAPQLGPVPAAPSMGHFDWEGFGDEAAKQSIELASKAGGEGGGFELDDPLVFQNQRVAVVKKERQRAYEYFAQLAGELRRLPDAAWRNYDPAAQAKAHEAWLAQAKLLATSADLPAQDEMENEIERSLWAGWIKSWKLATQPLAFAPPTQSWPAIGDSMRKRLDALGISKDAGLEPPGWKFFTHGYLFDEPSLENGDKLRDWAKAYTPKQFLPGAASE